MAGYNLFRGNGNCNSCHLDGDQPRRLPLIWRGGHRRGRRHNSSLYLLRLGQPRAAQNPRDSFYYETTPDSFGFTPNPAGFTYTDLGLGTFLRSGYGSAPNPNSSWVQFAATSDGQMQTSSARNVAMVPPQCTGGTDAPGPYFQKEFFHNGYIKSLKQLVHFYNTRISIALTWKADTARQEQLRK